MGVLMLQVILMVLSVFVLIMALLVNAQTRKYLWELDNLMQVWYESTTEGKEDLRHEGTD